MWRNVCAKFLPYDRETEMNAKEWKRFCFSHCTMKTTEYTTVKIYIEIISKNIDMEK